MASGRTHIKTDVVNRTRRPLVRLPYDAAKNAVLGASFELSVVFVGETTMAKLNAAHRGKEGATDILSFTVGDSIGEIFICPAAAEKKAVLFHETYTGYVRRLLIHGLAHLKGYEHGSTMDRYEQQLRKRFSR